MLGPARRAGDSDGMFTLALMIALLGGGSPADAHAWRKLERGMGPARVAELIGVPLLRNAARGHELWIYDDGASVQFHAGAVSAWTIPASARPRPAPAAPVVKDSAPSTAQRTAAGRAAPGRA
jgi:hypothetical protein